MWKKLWAWVKKYSHLIIAGIGTTAGFILGVTLGRNHPDFKQLRADNAELLRQIGSLRRQYSELVNLNRLNEQQLGELARQLQIAETLVRQSEQFNTGIGDDITGLRETNQRLGEWIQKYGTQIQAINDSY